MVPEAAEAIDSGQYDNPQAQEPAEEGGDKGEIHRAVCLPGLSACQGCKESGACSIKVTTSSQEPNISISQALSTQNGGWSGA